MRDIRINENSELIVINGDFFVGESKEQSIQQILISAQGEWKEFPQIGCDIEKAKHGVIDRFLERNIKVQLEADGASVKYLNIDERGIDLEGSYG